MKLILIAMAALLLAAITMVASVSAQTGGDRPYLVNPDLDNGAADCSTATPLTIPSGGLVYFIPSDIPVGSQAADFDVCDPDGVGSINWRLSRDASGAFLISDDGVLTTARSFSGGTSLEVEVIFYETEAGGDADTFVVTVTVIQANRPPYLCDAGTRRARAPVNGFYRYEVYRDAPIGTVVADFDACDPDQQQLTWSLKDDADGLFLIDGDGVLTTAKDVSGLYSAVADAVVSDDILEHAFSIAVEFVERPTPTATPITTPAPTPVVADPTRTPTPAATASPTPTATPVSIDDRVSALENEVSTLRALIGALIDVLLGWRQSE